MEVIDYEGEFVIVRGAWLSQFFSFFVDSDSSSWTKKSSQARRYSTKDEAKKDLIELRRRARKALRASS